MRRQSIFVILLLLQVLFICSGCGSTKKDAESQQSSSTPEDIDDVVGIFEGLEDNHTAIFSFDGAETAFYFDDPTVQPVLYEAVSGSSYTLSYHFDDTLGLNVIYKISE